GLDALPKYSPDGKRVAFISHGGKYDWIGNTYLSVTGPEGGEVRAVGEKFDEMLPWFDPSAYHWSPDSKHIRFAGDRGMERHLFELDGKTGEVRALTKGALVHDRFSFSKDHKRVAFVIERSDRPAEVYVGELPKLEPRRLTTTNGHLDEVQL